MSEEEKSPPRSPLSPNSPASTRQSSRALPPTSSRERLSKSKKHRPGSRTKGEPASATAPTAASQAPVATTCRPRTAHGTRGLEPSRKKSKRSAAVQEPSRNNIRAVKPEASLSTKAPTAEPLATRQGNKTASEQVPSSADLVSTQCGQATSAADLPSAVKKDPQSTSSLVRHSETAWNEGNRFPWLPVIIALVVAALVGVLALTILLAKARAALGNAHVCPQSEKDLLVNCSLGVIQGVNVEVDDGRRARVFLGIPFGAAVSEDLRFGPAHEVTELRSIFLADKKGPACVQPNIFSFGQHDPSGVSDDCLTLNVYIPDACSVGGREPLPVLFIVTGRLSYTLGWSGAYDWQHLAARGQLVVVAPNHRMGVVGYLNRGENGTANIGVKDVLLAWRWTKVHIAAFGGDPDNVVPLAHSSGAVMMTALLAKPQLVTAKRAIILSQSLFTFSPSQAGDIGLNKTRKAAGLAGCCQNSTCSSLPLDVIVSCMSNMDASQLAEKLGFSFSLSELDVTSEPFGLKPRTLPVNNGYFEQMQMLMGNVMDENKRGVFTWLRRNNLTDTPLSEASHRLVDTLGLPHKLDSLINQYVGKDSNRDAALRRAFKLSTLVLQHCPLLEYAKRATEAGAQVHYFVLDEDPYPTPDGLNSSSLGDDLLFISGSPSIANGSATEAQRQLSRELMDKVAAFAKTGVPGPVRGVGDWPVYTGRNGDVVILSSQGSRVAPRWRKQECASVMDFLKIYS